MDTRRAFLALAFGAAGAAMARGNGSAQSVGEQPQGQAPQGDSLEDRGAPTGRTGAATRGARSLDGELALDLVAPLRGVGLTSVDQPELCYLMSGRTTQPMRLAISTPGEARPLADFELPRGQPAALGIVRLRDHGVRLAANRLCVWSVTLVLDPRAPSQDLVGSALIRYRPNPSALQAADRQAPAALARAGFWYDAVALAERSQAADRGTALAALFRQAELPAVKTGL